MQPFDWLKCLSAPISREDNNRLKKILCEEDWKVPILDLQRLTVFSMSSLVCDFPKKL